MLKRIYTIGHSTRDLEEFIGLLREQGLSRLADIRRFPGSRRHPHFSGPSMAMALSRHGVEYIHFEALGGRRTPRKDSPNGAWESEQFRGYADHMSSPEFSAAIEQLLSSARDTAIMCAEAVPWRCHRNLASDDLVRRGVEVIHLVGAGKSHPHKLNPMAKLEPGRVVYPPEQATIF